MTVRLIKEMKLRTCCVYGELTGEIHGS